MARPLGRRESAAATAAADAVAAASVAAVVVFALLLCVEPNVDDARRPRGEALDALERLNQFG